MASAGPPARERDRRRRRSGAVPLIVGGVGLAVLAAAAAALFLAPGPLVVSAAQAWLAAQGAPSRIEILSLSDHALSARVRIGPAADPDLTIDRLDVRFDLRGPWSGDPLGITPRRVRLTRPALKLSIDNAGRADWGGLAGVVRWAARQPLGATPTPDLVVDDGRVRVRTPGGELRLAVSGAMTARAMRLEAALAPFAAGFGSVRVDGAGGMLSLARRGEGLTGWGRLGPARVRDEGVEGRAGAIRIALKTPYPDPRRGWSGPVRLTAAAIDASATGGADVRGQGALDIDLSGTLSDARAAPQLSGSLSALAAVGAAVVGPMQVGGAQARLDLARVTAAWSSGRLTLAGAGRASVSAASLSWPQARARRLLAQASVVDATLGLGAGPPDGGAQIDGSLSGVGGLTPAALSALTGATRSSAPWREAAAALRAARFDAPAWTLRISGRGARFGTVAPIRLASAGGASAVLTGEVDATAAPDWRARGALALDAGGGGLPMVGLRAPRWRLSAGGGEAEMSGQASGDIGPVEGGRIGLAGRLSVRRDGLRFDLAGCAPLYARRLALDAGVAEAVSARVCPAAGPLLAADRRGWRAEGRVESAEGQSKALALALRQGAGAFAVEGGAGGLKNGAIREMSFGLADLGATPRFRRLRFNGEASLAGGIWRGELAASAKGREVGRLLVSHVMASGEGRADIDAAGLAFVPGALQPADLTPMAVVARNAAGAAGFRGWFAWRPGVSIQSGGELAVRNFSFTAPSGPVSGVNGEIRFTSLAPPTTAPNQRLTIARAETITPLTNLAFAFDLDAQTARVTQAKADFAGGTLSLEPLAVALSGGGDLAGVLVMSRVNLGQVIAATSLADQIRLQAVVDGRIPFKAGPAGVSIDRGSLIAIGGGRLSISRSALTSGQAGASASASPSPPAAVQTSLAQDFAYQALENLAFDSLDASLSSLPRDRLGVIFHIKGRHDPPTRQRAQIQTADVLSGRALSKPVKLPSDTRIDLTLDTSLNFGELVGGLQTAWREALSPGAAGAGGAGSAPSREQERDRP